MFASEAGGPCEQDMLRCQVHNVSPCYTLQLLPLASLLFIETLSSAFRACCLRKSCQWAITPLGAQICGSDASKLSACSRSLTCSCASLKACCQIVGLVEGLGEEGVAEVGEVGFFGATKGHAVGAGGGHDQAYGRL